MSATEPCATGKMAYHSPMQSKSLTFAICMGCHMTTLIFYPKIRFKRRKGTNMNEPNGTDLLALLIRLLADQEGVHIEYQTDEEAA
jgi:hypothetical protein